MFYRVFFNSEDFIDFTSLKRDADGRVIEGIDKDGFYSWIGTYQIITLMPEKGEVIDSKMAWKAGF